MKRTQQILFNTWSGQGCTSSAKKQKESKTSANEDEGVEASADYDHDERPEPICASAECEDNSLTLAHCSKQLPVMSPVNVWNDYSCTSPCCSIERERETYQIKERAILSSFVKNGHKFLLAWYEKYAWITLCYAEAGFLMHKGGIVHRNLIGIWF